ncbi:MAG: carotenoid biosynthesis protein [Candidatus Omnitrophica bacterium]|nr:carotenoid biosynthesis protein [Candidatus Omnitrophota bacterium]
MRRKSTGFLLSSTARMRQRRNERERQLMRHSDRLCRFYYAIYGAGVVGMALPVKTFFLSVVPVVLFVSAVLLFTAVFSTVRGAGARRIFLVWCGLVFGMTMFLEALGVNYGLVFGAYVYSDILGVQLWGVPLLIGIKWLTVILGAVAAAITFTARKWLIITVAGVIAVLFDYLLEPAALYLGFWRWDGPIPLSNYLAWFLIAAAGAAVLVWRGISFDGRAARALLTAQTLFFAGIRLLMLVS